MRMLTAILVLWSGLAWAGPGTTIVQGPVTVAAGGGGCDGTQNFVGTPGVTETFENGTGAFCTSAFAENDASGYIDTYSATQYHADGHALEILNDGIDSANSAYADMGASEADFTLTFWWRSPDNGTVFSNGGIFVAHTGTDASAFGKNGYIFWDGQGSNGKFGFGIESTSGATLTTNTFAYATWYKIEILYHNNATTYVNVYNAGESLIEGISLTLENRLTRYLHWVDSTNTVGTTYVDDVQLNTTDP